MSTTAHPQTESAEHNPSPEPTGRLIGLGGRMRAGKDAVGDYLAQEHGFEKMGMSDALNDALLKLNPYVPVETEFEFWTGYGTEEQESAGKVYDWVPYAELHEEVGYVEAKKNPEVRRLLQALGTEVGREMLGENVWVEIAEKKILEHWRSGRDVVITALRFPNELEMLERLGGTSVWIERPGEETSMGELSEHASENSVEPKDFDYVLMNDGTLDQLYRKVEKRLIVR